MCSVGTFEPNRVDLGPICIGAVQPWAKVYLREVCTETCGSGQATDSYI